MSTSQLSATEPATALVRATRPASRGRAVPATFQAAHLPPGFCHLGTMVTYYEAEGYRLGFARNAHGKALGRCLSLVWPNGQRVNLLFKSRSIIPTPRTLAKWAKKGGAANG